MTRQPEWKCVAQLGDVNPIDYGGLWVLIDQTGVYCAEVELLVSPDSDDNGEPYIVYRFDIERCTFINGILSDNKYHPNHSVWFAKPESGRKNRPQDTTYLRNVADFVGQSVDEMISQLCSDDPINRAFAYRAVGEYHGFDEFDSYPLTLTRTEVEERYSRPQYRTE